MLHHPSIPVLNFSIRNGALQPPLTYDNGSAGEFCRRVGNAWGSESTRAWNEGPSG